MDFSELKNFDINQLNDVNNLGSLPSAVKAILIALVFVIVIGAGYYFDTKGLLENLDREERKETQLRQKFETEQRKVANLEELKQQLEEMRRSFGAMLRQLPSKTEIPNLIVDISQTGLSAGLEIELFRPEAEVRKGFYAEKPIELRVIGNYHQMGNFVSGVAALPRIVTLHDITMAPMDDGRLKMEATAKTYRYLDDQSGE